MRWIRVRRLNLGREADPFTGNALVKPRVLVKPPRGAFAGCLHPQSTKGSTFLQCYSTPLIDRRCIRRSRGCESLVNGVVHDPRILGDDTLKQIEIVHYRMIRIPSTPVMIPHRPKDRVSNTSSGFNCRASGGQSAMSQGHHRADLGLPLLG